MKEKKVSIILSVYNYKKYKNLEAVICSILNQTIQCEIVISEQDEKETEEIKALAQKYNLKYVFSLPDFIDNNVYYNIGRVRNIGRAVSTGDYIYFNDADVVFIDQDYIEKNITLMERYGFNLARPKMYRLDENDSEEYINDFIKNFSISYNFKNDKCFVSYDSNIKKVVESKIEEIHENINGTPHVISKENYIFIENKNDFDLNKFENFFWMATYHYGGVFLKRDTFDSIGGYCQSYYNWGQEDDDMQWKLKEKCGLVFTFEKDETIRTLHFEHDRNYNNQIFKKNKSEFARRRNEGLDHCINQDKINLFNELKNYKVRINN